MAYERSACEKLDTFWLGFYIFITVCFCIIPMFQSWNKDKLTPFEHYLKAKYGYDARN